MRPPTPPLFSVLLLHGAWHDAWCWKLVESRLSDTQIAWNAPDLPLADFATDMAAARLALKSCTPPVVVVGHSQGGWLAAHLAAEGGRWATRCTSRPCSVAWCRRTGALHATEAPRRT